MKLSRLIAILANHLVEHGDASVVMTDSSRDRDVTHCWYDYDEDTESGTGKVHIGSDSS